MRGKKKWILILAFLLLSGVFAGCSNQPVGGDSQGDSDTALNDGKISLHLDQQDYPRVDGSTATIPLSEAFGAAVNGDESGGSKAIYCT